MALDDKYQNFSDPTIKDRLSFAAVHTNQPGKKKVKHAPDLEPSGFSSTGWDKYFFFSVSQADNGGIHPSAQKGRARPAMTGPQTFAIEAFSPEDIARAKVERAGQGERTSYGDSFSQIPRSRIHEHGPVDYPRFEPMVSPSSTLAKSASDSILAPKGVKAVHLLAGAPAATRHGPHWPPPGPERPDPLKSRMALFEGKHRTISDLHCRDRQGARSYNYTLTNI
mmetsp:Transcript_96595/g.207220  ORF Transcript_96595/g.207220 Transcript_96595/m.207220 type:complete len:224 (-) Transcript_96595:55-726(-)